MTRCGRTARNTSPAPLLIYGEEINSILDVLEELFASAVTSGGLLRVELSVTHERFEPFLRALLRAEAELVIADAARNDLSDRMLRSAGNRSADALVLLAWRTLAGAGAPDCEPLIQAVLDDVWDAPAA